MDSRCVLGSSPGGHFWHPKSRVLAGLGREALKRESGGIRSAGDLLVDLGDLGLDLGIPGIPCFHLNSWVLTFCLNATFLCKFRLIQCRWWSCAFLSHIAFRMCLQRTFLLTYAAISAKSLRSLARYGSPAYLPPLASKHPASTLPTRFPAALGIGHDPAFGLANACALVYVAA